MTTTLAAAATSTGSPLWFITRASALVAFGLLTLSFLLGLLATGRNAARAPRFVTQALHRNATLLALGFVLVHIGSTALDGFVSVGWLAAVLPFTSGYRTTWVTFGTLTFDLMILLTVTSLLRVRIGLRLWRGIHWLAYLLWPLALVHYLGAGTDTKANWGLWLAILAAALVAGAIAVRVIAGLARDGAPGQGPRAGLNRGAGPSQGMGRGPEARPVRGAPVGRPSTGGGHGSYGSYGGVAARPASTRGGWR